MRALPDRLLLAFNAWFASRAGVWHTLAIVLAIVVVERIDPHLDPSMFALMAYLTVYSALTQPALAVVGAESAARLEQVQREHALMLAAVREMLAVIQATEAREAETLTHIEQELSEDNP